MDFLKIFFVQLIQPINNHLNSFSYSLGYMMSINTLTTYIVVATNYYEIDSSYSLKTTSNDICEV